MSPVPVPGSALAARSAVAFVALVVLVAGGCGGDDTTNGTPDAGPTPTTDAMVEDRPPYTLEEIALPGADLFPEGVAVTADGTFFVGSLTGGSVHRLVAGETEPEVFVATGDLADRPLGSAVGMIVDAAEQVLWVCDGGGLQGTRIPAVVGFALAGGGEVARHPLPGGQGLCNDVALDAAGNVYATDSFAPRVLRIASDAKLTGDAAAEWATSPDWAVNPGEFGLNGVAVAGDALYLAHTRNNAAYRVAIAGDGSAGEIVQLTLDRTPNGLDGLKVAGDGSLIFVEGYANQLTRIALDGDEGTLGALAEDLDGPTTFAFFADSAWIVEGQLEHLFDTGSGPPNLPFKVVRRPLDDALIPR